MSRRPLAKRSPNTKSEIRPVAGMEQIQPHSAGIDIVRAIADGERDPYKLASLRNYRCKKGVDEIAKALTGNWRNEHLFVLEQSLYFYDIYREQIEHCDREIAATYSLIRPDWPSKAEEEQLPPSKSNTHSKNAPRDANLRMKLKHLAGVDLVAVDGLSVSLGQTIISECGTDLHQFPTDKHFSSWLGLASKNEISGGRVL